MEVYPEKKWKVHCIMGILHDVMCTINFFRVYFHPLKNYFCYFFLSIIFTTIRCLKISLT